MVKKTVDNKADNKAADEAQGEGVNRRSFMKQAAAAAGAATVITGTSNVVNASTAETLSTDSTPITTPTAGTQNMPLIASQHTDIKARYQRAQDLLSGAIDGKKIVMNTLLHPHWIGDSDAFWYRSEDQSGHHYQWMDAGTGDHQPAFNHPQLALALSKASGQTVAAERLPLLDLDLTQRPQTLAFTALGKRWRYQANNHQCEALEIYPEEWTLSPDGKSAAFSRDYNLWVKDLRTGEERALTQDGERFFEYAGHQSFSVYGKQGPSESLEVLWSPDSQTLFTVVIDIRELGIASPLVQHVPGDGNVRPRILQGDRRLGLPEDDQIEAYQLLAIHVASGSIQRADYRPCPVMYPPYMGYFSGGRGWWDSNSRHAYFIDQERGGKTLNLVKFDTETGQTQVLFTETSDAVVTIIPLSHMKTLLKPLPETDELIWFSRRSGWGHLYLYELSTGRLKKSLTQGEWVLRNVLHVDTARREVFIQTAGRVKGRNPYYADICKVNMDSAELTTLLSSDHHYQVCDQASRYSMFAPKAAGVSPGARHLVATRTRVDETPLSLLLDLDTGEQRTVEAASVLGLSSHWRWPEPVLVKAADGVTDIDAVVFRPSDYDPRKSYPVLDISYAYVGYIGFSRACLSAAAYAELGFIVVTLNNRGNDNLRSTAFSEYQNPDFPVDPLLLLKCFKDDAIAGIQQLAAREPALDIERVGAVEVVSVPMALAGLLHHPDFYKVGVSLCAMTDTRMTGALGRHKDRWPQFESFADNLRGKLLLITGMMDWAVSPSSTFRLVEALEKANKRFDMLFLPNLTHGGNRYTTQRTWDYLVEHLLGIEPPVDVDLIAGGDPYHDSVIKELEAGAERAT